MTTKQAVSFTRRPNGYAEPIPEGKEYAKWETPLDWQLDHQPCTARRVSAWGFSCPIRLIRRDVEWDDVYDEWVQVWEVPADAWHPGDRVEIGRQPHGIHVRFEPIHPTTRTIYTPLEVA